MIDELGHFVDHLEGCARAMRDKSREVHSGYRARHPPKVERFLGSLNLFRSKKRDVDESRPSMPAWETPKIPDTSAEFARLKRVLLPSSN